MKHKKMMKKVLSLILCLTLLFPEVPVRAEGETEGDTGEWENTSSEEGYGLKDPRLIRTGWDEFYEYDTIWFGSYVQDDITGEQKNSIRWRVLDVSGNEALLISDSILDVQPFHDVEDRAETMEVWWHDSTLRSWLNGYGEAENSAGKDYSGEGDSFITKAFTTVEREALIPDTQKAESGYCGLLKKELSEPDTLDKVGLIGPAEINEKSYCLFNKNGGPSNLGMRQKASNYVLAQSRGLLRYWLRMMYNRGWTEDCTIEYTEQFGKGYYVHDAESSQKHNDFIYYKNEAHGVVARIRLDLSQTDLWSYAGTTTNEGLDDFSDAAPMPVCVDYSRQVLPATEGLKLSDDGMTALSYEGESYVVVIPEGVEELDPDFYLNSVEICYLHLPSTLKSIPDECFRYEKRGKKKGDSDLTYVRFNDPSKSQLKTIGEYAFYDQQLFEILLPEGLEEIKAHAFDDGFRDVNGTIGSVGNHTNMNFPDGLKTIGENAFKNVEIQYFRFGSGLENLGKGAFLYSDIVTVDLSRCKKLKTIPEDCFRCSELNAGLLNVVLNDGLEEIGAGAFAVAGNDSKPIRIVVPDSVKSIGDEAFAGGSIEKLILPETLDYFGEHVISLAGSLHYLRLPKNLTKIDGIFRKLSYEDTIPRILVCEGDVSEVIWGGAAGNTYIPQYIIYGKAGTALEETARENNLTFYDCTKNPPPGDYEIRITERDLNVVADGDALCSYDENVLRLMGKGTYKISMKEGVSSTTDCIVIGSDCTVELDNVDIRTDSKKDYGIADWTYGGFAGIWIPTNSSAKVTILFKGTNTIKGSGSLIGIMKYSRNSAGQLTLKAASGTDADVISCNGIGYDDLSGNRPQDEYGNHYYHSHNITIESGTVKSSFGNCGSSNFQINGGVLETDSLGNLKVNGGTVKVKNGVDHFSKVRINDGDVSLTTIESESKIEMYGGRLNIKDYSHMDGELEYHGGYVFSGEEQIYPSPTPTGGDKKQVTSISLNKSELKLKAGESEKLTATIVPEDAEDKSVEWSSDNTSVATVDVSGNVIAVAEGTAKIKVTAKDGSGVSASCTVTVEKDGKDEPAPSPAAPIPGGEGATDPQPAITGEAEQSLLLVKGQKFALAQKDWNSSDKTVVAVSKGNVTVKKAGTAVLSRGKDAGKQEINVTAVDFPIGKADKTIKLFVGNNGMVTKLTELLDEYNEGKDASAQLAATYQSMAPDVATINEAGELMAVSKGKAVINAYVNGVVYKFTVKVADVDTTKPPFGDGEISIWAEPMQSYRIKAAGFNAKKAKYSSESENAIPENALKKGIAYEDDVVRITKAGKLTAIGVGETTITTSGGGKDFSFTVNVREPVRKSLHLNVKGNKTLKMYGTKGKLDWKAYDPEDLSKEISGVVAIKGNKITGGAVGKAVLKAEYEGFTYLVDVYVEDPSLKIEGELKGKPASAKWETTPGQTLTIVQTGVYQEVLFTSNKSSVAFVDEEGVIHARSKGNAKITAKVNGKRLTINVTVK